MSFPFDQDHYPSGPPSGMPPATPAPPGQPPPAAGSWASGPAPDGSSAPLSTPGTPLSTPGTAGSSAPLPTPAPTGPAALGWTSARARVGLAVATVGVVLFAAVGGGLVSHALVDSSTPSAIAAPARPSGPVGASPPSTDPTPADPAPGNGTENGGGSLGSGGTTTERLSDWSDVVATVEVGVVNIESLLPRGVGAGTGMVLTDTGEILTNNHVVADATKIVVTVATTGESYSAILVGSNPSEDVAVLQVQGATGLSTIPLGDSDTVTVGDPVAAIGNAGGRGGEPSVATGEVVALGRRITASDADGSNSETLRDMIQVDADVVPGDSGGPLANSSGEVVGMNSAASANNGSSVAGLRGPTRTSEGYAIPINKALAIAEQLVTEGGGSANSNGSNGSGSGSSASSLRPFLGVSLEAAPSGGATVASVMSGSPAARAGLSTGDTIVSVDGTAVADPEELVSTLAQHHPGDGVSLTWEDTTGQLRQATVTLTGR